MRLEYAKWLVEMAETHGIGLERGEYAEWKEAELRVYGLAGLPHTEILPIESDVDIGERVLGWEPEVLAGMAHELLESIHAAAENDDDGP